MEAILTAAAQVFEARGFAAGTTNRVAARAGVSIGTLYQYFSDKHAIARALVERHLAGMLRDVEGWATRVLAMEPGLRRALRSLVETALAAHEEQPRLHQVLLEEAPLPVDVHDLIRRAERDAARTVAGVLRRHREVGRRDLLRAAQFVVWLATDLAHRFASGAGGMSRAAFLSEATDLCEAYALSQDGAPEVEDPRHAPRAALGEGRRGDGAVHRVGLTAPDRASAASSHSAVGGKSTHGTT